MIVGNSFKLDKMIVIVYFYIENYLLISIVKLSLMICLLCFTLES